MNIALLADNIPQSKNGGAEQVVWNLAAWLGEKGHTVHIITTGLGDMKVTPPPNVIIHNLQNTHPFAPHWQAVHNGPLLKEVRPLLAEIKVDVVNAHNIYNALSYGSLKIAQGLGLPTVFTSHDVMPVAYGKMKHFIHPDLAVPVNPALYKIPLLHNVWQMRRHYNPFRTVQIRRLIKRYTNMRVAVSNAHQQALAMNGLAGFQVVYNGVRPQRFAASAGRIEGLRAKLNLAGRKVILFGGRVTYDKGITPLLSALRNLKDIHPEAMLLILSANPLDPGLFEGVADRVRLGGWLDGEDLAAAYGVATVVAMPSLCFETAGMMALEGMAAGKPVIASGFGGTAELVAHKQTGWVINPLQPSALEGALREVLSDPERAAHMGQLGRARVEENFSLDRQGEHMLAIYEEAITRRKHVKGRG
jgi:glycosyltransferase involved in cell wall biosynthesis